MYICFNNNNLNTSKPSEHPRNQGGKLGGNIGCKDIVVTAVVVLVRALSVYIRVSPVL